MWDLQEKNFVEAFQAAVQAALAGKQAGAAPSSLPAASCLRLARSAPGRYSAVTYSR